MDTTVIHLVILGVISGLTRGAGLLPDCPLEAAVGEKVMFTTNLSPTTFVSVSWQLDGNNVITFSGRNTTSPQFEGRITLFMSTGSLELRNVTVNDSGEYSVSVIRFGGAAEDGRITLDVYVRVSNVKVNTSTTDSDLMESISSVRLSCSSSGSSLSFLWLNGSSEVTGSDRVQLTDGNSTITIANVTRYDQGPFRCRVFNPVSDGTSGPETLFISYGPDNIILTVTPSQEYHEERSDIILSCSADCRPAPLFTWFLDGDLLSDTGPELRLMNIQMSQSGNYSCQAFNNRTMRYERSQPATISILIKPPFRCGAGCIAGIVITLLVILGAAAVAAYCYYKKKNPMNKVFKRNIANSTGGQGLDNAPYLPNQELHYSDIRISQEKDGVREQQVNDTSEYAQIQVNMNAASAPSFPAGDVHLQQLKRSAPQPDDGQL